MKYGFTARSRKASPKYDSNNNNNNNKLANKQTNRAHFKTRLLPTARPSKCWSFIHNIFEMCYCTTYCRANRTPTGFIRRFHNKCCRHCFGFLPRWLGIRRMVGKHVLREGGEGETINNVHMISSAKMDTDQRLR